MEEPSGQLTSTEQDSRRCSQKPQALEVFAILGGWILADS